MHRAVEEQRSRRFAAHGHAEGLAKEYILGAMLPAVVTCIVLTAGLHLGAGAALLHAALVAVLLALASLLHWILCGRGALHVAFVALLVACTWALARTFHAMRLLPLPSLVLAAALGYGLALLLVAAATLLWLCRNKRLTGN